MKKNQQGFTFIELLLGIVLSSAIFLVASSALVFILGTTAKNKIEQSMEQTKNDIQVSLGNQIRWAEKIDFVGGRLKVDADTYEVRDGVLYKNGSQLTVSEVEITKFDVKRYTSVSEAQIPSQGIGLTGQYYNDKNFVDLLFSRLDSEVNFNWGSGSPDPQLSADTFSVRWLGKVETPDNARYTFYTTTDDGVRLWVDDNLIIDSWNPGGFRDNSGSITLSGGKLYSLRMDYFDDLGDSAARLYWSYKNTSKQVIPSSRLYPTTSSVSVEVTVDMRLRNARSIQDTLKLYLSPRGGFVGSIEDLPSGSPLPTLVPTIKPSLSPSPTAIPTPS